MIDTGDALAAIGSLAVLTFGLRALPFLAARWLSAHAVVERMGRFLPLTIMTLLLLHAIADGARSDPFGPWPELVSATLTGLIQWQSRNALFSIVAGTTLYMLLRRLAGA